MTARKRFGQHFLHDPAVAARIVRSAGIQPGDRVVEVGPGRGILTQALRDAGAALKAIEIDRDLVEPLRDRFPGLDLIVADALAVDWAEVAPGSGWQIVANLPYNVATPLVRNWLGQPSRFRRLTVMLQEEVAARLVARPGDEAWSRLSLGVAVRARTTWVLGLGPGSFKPPPAVRSAVVRIEPFEEPDFGPAGEAAFDRVTAVAFAQRRKTLRNALLAAWPTGAVDAALEACRLNGRDRAEVLDVAAFRALAAALPVEGRAVMP
jgi:16S rRNA (adenine1518-N6/adenine1519-N6)-dimethyltransferase